MSQWSGVMVLLVGLIGLGLLVLALVTGVTL